MEWAMTPWFWFGLALALFAVEALAPGAFMLWLGFAATATGITVLLLPLSGLQQWIAFAVLGLVAVAIGWRWRRNNPETETDQPLLNRRADQLIGRVLTLGQPLQNGRGKLKIGDALWSVESDADWPEGTRVRVDAVVDSMSLRISKTDV